jgi:hypothetical protein
VKQHRDSNFCLVAPKCKNHNACQAICGFILSGCRCCPRSSRHLTAVFDGTPNRGDAESALTCLTRSKCARIATRPLVWCAIVLAVLFFVRWGFDWRALTVRLRERAGTNTERGVTGWRTSRSPLFCAAKKIHSTNATRSTGTSHDGGVK